MAQDNLELLRRLETQQATARRRAVWISWLFVLAAAIVLAVLIFAADRHLEDAQAKKTVALEKAAAEQNRVEQLKKEEARLTGRIKQLQPLVENYQAQVRAEPGPATQREVQFPLGPGPGVEVPAKPRVFLQIVTPEDREYAKQMGQRLEEAGFEVLGTEYVERAAALKNTEVRYYKKTDEPDAVKLRDALSAAGVKSPALLYLGLENNKKVRPKTYEVWFGAGVGGSPPPQ
jgi:hypothetical protein